MFQTQGTETRHVKERMVSTLGQIQVPNGQGVQCHRSLLVNRTLWNVPWKPSGIWYYRGHSPVFILKERYHMIRYGMLVNIWVITEGFAKYSIQKVTTSMESDWSKQDEHINFQKGMRPGTRVTLKIDSIEKWTSRSYFNVKKWPRSLFNCWNNNYDRGHFSTVSSHFSTLKSDLFCWSHYIMTPYILNIDPPVEIWLPIEIWFYVNCPPNQIELNEFQIYWAPKETIHRRYLKLLYSNYEKLTFVARNVILDVLTHRFSTKFGFPTKMLMLTRPQLRGGQFTK